MKYITTVDNGLVMFSDGYRHQDIRHDLGLQVRSAGSVNSGLIATSGSVSLEIERNEEKEKEDQRTIDYHFRGY